MHFLIFMFIYVYNVIKHEFFPKLSTYPPPPTLPLKTFWMHAITPLHQGLYYSWVYMTIWRFCENVVKIVIYDSWVVHGMRLVNHRSWIWIRWRLLSKDTEIPEIKLKVIFSPKKYMYISSAFWTYVTSSFNIKLFHFEFRNVI